MPPPPPPSRPRYFSLRPQDQRIVALLALLCLVAAAGSWWHARGGWGGHQLAEVDDEVPRELDFEVDINQAAWPELAQLPRIGETLARRIVASRESEGPFQSLRDLERVRGIGPKTAERIGAYLTGFEREELPAVAADAGVN